MYGTEPEYNDLRYNDIPYMTMRFEPTEWKIFPDIMVLSQCNQNIEFNTITLKK